MGIGAYESREFVRAMGGHIDVTSEIGKGTVFRILLPLSKERVGSDVSQEVMEVVN